MTQTMYALDNAQQGAGTSLGWLAQAYDSTTKAILEPLIPASGRMLELGAGTGTIARWAADRAGSGGVVVAADIDTRLLTTYPGVRVVQHNLLTGSLSALGVDEPDVIHARCLFAHLGNRDDLLPECVAYLRPGGYLVVEDMGGGAMSSQVLCSPYGSTADLLAIYNTALIKMFEAADNDTTWASRTHAVMGWAGLQEIRTLVSAQSWRGGTAGCRLIVTLSAQVEDKLITNGATKAELAELRLHLADPEVAILGTMMWSTIGQKPMEG